MKTKHFWIPLLIIIGVILFFTLSCEKDKPNETVDGPASITGIVKDLENEPVITAKIDLKLLDSDQGWTAMSDEHGRFSFENLKADIYLLQLTLPTGYDHVTSEVQELLLSADQKLNVTLEVRAILEVTREVAAKTSDILYTASGAVIEVQTGEKSVNITVEDISEPEIIPSSGNSIRLRLVSSSDEIGKGAQVGSSAETNGEVEITVRLPVDDNNGKDGIMIFNYGTSTEPVFSFSQADGALYIDSNTGVGHQVLVTGFLLPVSSGESTIALIPSLVDSGCEGSDAHLAHLQAQTHKLMLQLAKEPSFRSRTSELL